MTILIARDTVASNLDRCADDALMALTRDGHRRAFDVLVQRYQRRLLGSANRYLQSPAAARDAVQATFVELYCYVPRYCPEAKLHHLLWRILMNQCRLQQRRVRSDLQAAERAARREHAAPNSPDEPLQRQDQQRQIDRALAHLSAKLRGVVVLRFAAELSYEEIASTLEVPVGTVKSRLAAALDKLKKYLESERGSP